MPDAGSAAADLTSDIGHPTSGEAEGLDPLQELIAALRAPRPPVEFVRDPTTGRISGARYLHPQLPPAATTMAEQKISTSS
jgi:hypothetical protein